MKRLKELFFKDYKGKVIRLRDLEIVTDQRIDYSYVVYRILGYKDSWLDKYIFRSRELRRAYKYALEIVKRAQSITPNNVEVESSIEKPSHIDYISFRAMMELTAVINQGQVTTMSHLISHIITIACFSQRFPKIDYDSDSIQFKSFQNHILNQPLEEMLSIYNWVMKSLDESNRIWNSRFEQVAIEQVEYDEVGGSIRQAPFNVITTIRGLCNDFNVTYDEAWQLSYAVTQTNSLSKATSTWIQDQMRQRMESKMEAKRKRNKYS